MRFPYQEVRMSGNKEAYDAAYQRALDGRSPNLLRDLVLRPFEDEYTRQSRLKGQKDGAAARAATEAIPAQDAR
jgi:hypothetical protein